MDTSLFQIPMQGGRGEWLTNERTQYKRTQNQNDIFHHSDSKTYTHIKSFQESHGLKTKFFVNRGLK